MLAGVFAWTPGVARGRIAGIMNHLPAAAIVATHNP
jgi:hypothetical protein